MTRRAVPAFWPTRFYYGWALVWALGFTATVSYGILSYGFAAFITPMGAELGWSKTQITGAFSLAQLVAGVSAIPVGRWVDRYGPRSLMTAGSLLAALLLVAWSGVGSLPMYYLVWALMGVAMAAVLYEPAFAVIATWFRRRRSRALTILTFLGGFASVIFVPLATMLVSAQGWRAALVSLAVLYALLTVPVHALLLRHRPEDIGLVPDLPAPELRAEAGIAESLAVGDVIRTPAFRWTAIAFTLSGMATTAIAVHLVPLLLERGHSPAFAGSAMGVLGLMALPGRLIFTPLGARRSRSVVTASIFALQAVAVIALLATTSAIGVWVFVTLFGAGFGAITPARAALVGDLVTPSAYGRVNGVLAFVVSLARAAAPVGASMVYTMGSAQNDGYGVVLMVLLALCLASAVAVLSTGAAARNAMTLPLEARA